MPTAYGLTAVDACEFRIIDTLAVPEIVPCHGKCRHRHDVDMTREFIVEKLLAPGNASRSVHELAAASGHKCASNFSHECQRKEPIMANGVASSGCFLWQGAVHYLGECRARGGDEHEAERRRHQYLDRVLGEPG